MKPLKRALQALGFLFLLAGHGPLSAQDGAQEPSRLALSPFPSGSASTFEGWIGYLEKYAGPALPEWAVHSTTFRYSARKPLYDDGGNPLLGADGRQVCAQVPQSGRVFFPPGWRVPFRRSLPLVLYTHATTMLKHGVASEFGGHEWVLAAAAAVYYGFAVAMPDQPGMGADAANYHPFCHAKSLAYATVDSLPALERMFQEDPFLVSRDYAWDGRLYVVGYSEGAYTALATVKELETNPGGYHLTGSACMAGPFDLSGLTRADIINPMREYAHCFYLPYVIRGYHAVYGRAVDPAEAFAPLLLETREDGNILQWTDGTLNGLAVDTLIGKRLGVDGSKVIFRNILNPAFLARELDDPAYETSLTHKLLRDNDLNRGWAPTKPILFSQSPNDQDLPYQNTVATLGYLAAEIHKSGRDPRKLLASLPIGDCRDGITHIEGAAVAMPTAFNWIFYGMPME